MRQPLSVFLLCLLLPLAVSSYRPVTCDQVRCPSSFYCVQEEDLSVSCVKTESREVRCKMVKCAVNERCAEIRSQDVKHPFKKTVGCVGVGEERPLPTPVYGPLPIPGEGEPYPPIAGGSPIPPVVVGPPYPPGVEDQPIPPY